MQALTDTVVVDSSAAVEALTGRSAARELLSSTSTYAPHLIDAEVAQAMRGLVRRGHLLAIQAQQLLEGWGRLGIVRFALHPLLARVWELRENLSAYDATYVALAEELGCPLVTADTRLGGAPGLRCEVRVLDP